MTEADVTLHPWNRGFAWEPSPAPAVVRRRAPSGFGNSMPGNAKRAARPERAAAPMRNSESGVARPTRRRKPKGDREVAIVEPAIACPRQPAARSWVATTAQLALVLLRCVALLHENAASAPLCIWRFCVRWSFRSAA